MPEENLSDIARLLAAVPDHGFFFVLKLVFIILSVLMAVAIVILLFKSSWMQERYGSDLKQLFGVAARYRAGKMEHKLQRIRARLDKADESEHKIAVIEAEELLDDFLDRRGLQGDTLPDKLAQVDDANLPRDIRRELDQAYQVASSVISDPDYALSKATAQSTVKLFEKALKQLTELGA